MYNTAKYLSKCMDTLLNQDIPMSDYEIILVDDCSQDNSLKMAQEYAAKYLNVRVCKHDHNKGLAVARNTGMDAAIGEYLCFVDSDDYVEKNSFAVLLRQMDDEQLDMLRFKYKKVDEDGNTVPDYEFEARFDYSPSIMTGTDFLVNRLGIGCYVWAYIYRLDFLHKCGIRFLEGCFFDDTPWLPCVLQNVHRINSTPILHQYYLQRKGSMVHSHNMDALIRKVNTQMQLIDILKDQKQTANEDAHPWYDMMFAHTVVSLLTSVAKYDYRLSVNYYNQVKQKELFPLSEQRVSRKSKRKISMINKFPRLLLLLLYLKNHWKNR